MNTNNLNKKENRIWCDGCYDISHFGHANSFRQVKSMCKTLIVGIHSDNEILKHKGCQPVYTQDERFKLVKGIKWVDEVIENAPYITTLDILDKFNCNYCAHGNDITMSADGIDTYHGIKEANRYKNVERTAGISTTGIINRILQNGNNLIKNENHSKWTGTSPFLMTTSKIFDFMNNYNQKPDINDKVVYAPGSFDLFHTGHLEFLEYCKKQGDYLIVGLYSDEIIKKFKGNLPIMNLQERAFNILSYKCVDEIIIGAPYFISEDLLQQLKIETVYHGYIQNLYCTKNYDPYVVCKKLDKFKICNVINNVTTTESIMQRIIKNKSLYEKRNTNKEVKEIQFYETK